VGNLSLRCEPSALFAEVFHPVHAARHFHSPAFLVSSPHVFSTAATCAKGGLPPVCVSLRLCGAWPAESLRLRPGDLFKSCLAAFLDHLQLALARLLHSDSGARVQSLMALRFQLQKTVLETDHQVVGDQPLGPQAKHPLQVQTLR